MKKKHSLVELVKLKRKAVKIKASPRIIDRIQSLISLKTQDLMESKNIDPANIIDREAGTNLLQFKLRKIQMQTKLTKTEILQK